MDIDEGTDIDSMGDDALAPGSKLLSGQYEILRYLSSGGFGITYLAKDSLNRTVVIKECFPEAFCSRVNKTVRARTKSYVDDFRSIVQLFIREAHALSRLDHPSVVGVHQVFEDNETAYMALDLIEGKDLLDVIESGTPELTPDQIRGLTLKLLDAIDHVHSQDLLHRDISPDNILVGATGHPVLIDFGAAREEASRKSRVLSAVLVVKDGYSPQEFYVAGSAQHPCSDLYALAATLVHLISGVAPPNSQARLAALASADADPYQPLFGRFAEYDDAFLQAIDQAMSIMPAERVQSADDWSLMIDHTKRVERARAKALDDKNIDQTVMNLVRTVNAEPEPAQVEPDVDELPMIDLSENVAARDAEHAVAQFIADCAAEEEDRRPSVEKLDPEAECVFDADAEHGVHQPVATDKPTPYLRVTSKAVQAQQVKQVAPVLPTNSRRYARYVTVPIIFVAYFFYAHTVLQLDVVQSAAVQPLIAFGENLGSWNDQAAPTVTVRRGAGG